MRVNREQAAASRERILDAAARRFRERGLDGIGVADLMKDAGFTHGGFYAHFDSKEDLVAQACAAAPAGALQAWAPPSALGPGKALARAAGARLSGAPPPHSSPGVTHR